jgi:hypothetical protein
MRDKIFKYVYYITYHTARANGDCFLYRRVKINTEEQVRSCIKYISENYCKGEAVILDNFTLLNKKGIH